MPVLEAQWYEDIPPVEVVAAHESEHYPIMGMPFCRITTARNDKPDREHRASQGKYGDWLVLHLERFGLPAYPSTCRFREIEGEIFMQNGFSFWQPLAECRWAYECKYFPLGPDGLPKNYFDIPALLAEIKALRQERDEVAAKAIVFSPEQVANLHRYQFGPFTSPLQRMHQFTCPNRGDGKHFDNGSDLGALIPTTKGWICQCCEYTQNWAHLFMYGGKDA